jgi:hypothetical protein
MKKLNYVAIAIICFIGLAGCSHKKLSLNPDKIMTSTLLAKADGQIQTVTVEDFSKNYYNLNDLEEYTLKQIEEQKNKWDKCNR